MTESISGEGNSAKRRFPLGLPLALLFTYFAVSWLQVSPHPPDTIGVEMQGVWIALNPVWLYPVILLVIILITETYVLYRVSTLIPSRGAWREVVCVQADFMEHQLNILYAYHERSKGIRHRRRDLEAEEKAEAQAACKATLAHLRKARQAANPEPSREGSRLDQLIDVWTGASIEAAFRSLHAAAVTMVPLLPEEEIEARIPEALARLKNCPSTDSRRQEAEKNLRSRISEVTLRSRIAGRRLHSRIAGARLRAEYASALEYGYEAKDDEHSRVREFRNILLGATAGLTAVVATLCVVGASFPDAVPLCFTPPSTTSPQQETAAVAQPATPPTTDDDPEPLQTTTTTTPPTTDDDREPDQTTTQGATKTTQKQKDTVCPSEEQPPSPRVKGRRLPAPGDVTLVALFGLLGGALSGAIAIRKMYGQSTPYGIPVALNLLKLPSGALTAIMGILLVRGAFVPGLSQLDSQPQILAYAFFFGIAQQFATQFIDRRAREVLGRVPTKTTPADEDKAKEPASE